MMIYDPPGETRLVQTEISPYHQLQNKSKPLVSLGNLQHFILMCTNGHTVGAGHDLYISNRAPSNTNLQADLGHTYSPPRGNSNRRLPLIIPGRKLQSFSDKEETFRGEINCTGFLIKQRM